MHMEVGHTGKARQEYTRSRLPKSERGECSTSICNGRNVVTTVYRRQRFTVAAIFAESHALLLNQNPNPVTMKLMGLLVYF